MWKTSKILAVSVTILTLGMVSCNRNVYDEDKYIEIIKYLSPVDSVDQRHSWQLTTHYSFRFTADVGSDIESVRVFTDNPLVNPSAELMGQASISKGKTVTLSVTAPTIMNTFYAALVDKNGNYYVTSFIASAIDVSFEDSTVGKPKGTTPPQAYTYLFEEDFPQPGDYDYNDLVLRVSQQRTGQKEITLNVTIAAVGASYHIAGGIRLVGFRYQDIDSVKTTTGVTFNDGVPETSLYMFPHTDLLLEGRNKEAVINLFVDAHWAMAFNPSVNYGLFQRKKYNVSTGTGDNYQLRATRTLSYVIYFNSESGLNSFTLDTLDPFIITEFGGGNFETHLDIYRDAQVLYEYATAKFKDLPWALKVPTSDFRYPLEGMEIGFKKKTDTGSSAMFGAYMTQGHSFGEWAEDYTKCLDWYLYPVETYVW
jgi:LruC domain-containing protein